MSKVVEIADDLVKAAEKAAEAPIDEERKHGAGSYPGIVEVNQAMMDCAGDRGTARIQLGVQRNWLNDFIHDTPALQHWKGNTSPTWVEKGQIPFQSRAINSVNIASLEKIESDHFKDSLSNVGVSQGVVPRLVAIRDLARRSFADTFELMHGGLTDMFIADMEEKWELLEMKKAIQARLKSDEEMDAMLRDQLLKEMLILGRQLREIGTEMLRATDSLQRGALTLAAMRQSSKKKKKWKFSPADK